MRPWRAGDEDAFELRADFTHERVQSTWDWSRGAPGPTWTILRWTGEIVGVGGVVEVSGARWQAWCWLAPLPRRDWPPLLWLANRALAFASDRYGVTDIEASARRRWAPAGRCLKRLGFVAAGRFARGGRAYDQFVRVAQ